MKKKFHSFRLSTEDRQWSVWLASDGCRHSLRESNCGNVDHFQVVKSISGKAIGIWKMEESFKNSRLDRTHSWIFYWVITLSHSNAQNCLRFLYWLLIHSLWRRQFILYSYLKIERKQDQTDRFCVTTKYYHNNTVRTSAPLSMCVFFLFR